MPTEKTEAKTNGRARVMAIIQETTGALSRAQSTAMYEAFDCIGREAIDDFCSHSLRSAEARTQTAEATARREQRTREILQKEAATLTANLTDVQRRCTELLNATRLDAHFSARPGDVSAFLALAWTLKAARVKHPCGPVGMVSIAEEHGDVANALRRRRDRVGEELLDLAVVALRLYMGEHEPGALDYRPTSADADGSGSKAVSQ